MKDNTLSNGYSLADKVFKKLEEEILNGALKAGENLTELRISARLGVSRTPVREATWSPGLLSCFLPIA